MPAPAERDGAARIRPAIVNRVIAQAYRGEQPLGRFESGGENYDIVGVVDRCCSGKRVRGGSASGFQVPGSGFRVRGFQGSGFNGFQVPGSAGSGSGFTDS
jgi:hypothetical protein